MSPSDRGTGSTRIRRGGNSKLSTGPASGRPARAVKAGRAAKGNVNALIKRVPGGEAMLRRAMSWSVVALVLAVLIGVASFFGLPGMAHMEAAELAARVGYEVKKVEVHGTDHMDETSVYGIALGEVDRSMLNVDLGSLRDQIMRLSWVKDARIARRLPDTLVVDIVERKPAAVWQYQGRLSLIDEGGTVLEAVTPNKMPDLPLLVGPEANRQAPRLAKLMETAPALKSVLAGATWVGNRRWDLRFQSGETLALPEGDQLAASALVDFARLDGINRLLGRGITRFDMRDPEKLVLRMPKGSSAPALSGDHPPVSQEQPGTGEEAAKPGPTALASKEQG